MSSRPWKFVCGLVYYDTVCSGRRIPKCVRNTTLPLLRSAPKIAAQTAILPLPLAYFRKMIKLTPCSRVLLNKQTSSQLRIFHYIMKPRAPLRCSKGPHHFFPGIGKIKAPHAISFYLLTIHLNTRVGTLIGATIYLQLIQNRYMFRSFTLLHCSHQHCVQPVASDVEVVGHL